MLAIYHRLCDIAKMLELSINAGATIHCGFGRVLV